MKYFVLILFALVSSQGWAGGGSEVGNGGGLAEKNILFAYMNLPGFLQLCRNTPMCRLDAWESTLLEKISSSLSQEQKNPDQIVFRSSKADPDFFKIEGLIRVAKTGDHVGDPIYINNDLLYSSTGNEFKALDVPLAVSVLVHELGHHQGVKDHEKLDRLGSKLQILLLTDSERSEFWNANAALVTYQFNHVHSDDDKKKIRLIDEIVLENGTELYSLTQEIIGKMECPTPLKGSKKSPDFAIRFYNVHYDRGVAFDESTRILRKPEQAWYVMTCENGKQYDHGNVEFSLSFKKNPKGDFTYLPGTIEVRQDSCAKLNTACN